MGPGKTARYYYGLCRVYFAGKPVYRQAQSQHHEQKNASRLLHPTNLALILHIAPGAPIPAIGKRPANFYLNFALPIPIFVLV
jgi:hypothetical protein